MRLNQPLALTSMTAVGAGERAAIPTAVCSQGKTFGKQANANVLRGQ